jgi:chromosomal replication initiator protein
MYAKYIWLAALEHLKQSVTEVEYRAWFVDSTGVALEGEVLYVWVRTPYAVKRMQNIFEYRIGEALKVATGGQVRLEVRYLSGSMYDPARQEPADAPGGEAEAGPPQQYNSLAATQVSPAHARQQPLLPGEPGPSEAETARPGEHQPRPIWGHPPIFRADVGGEDWAEGVPLSQPPIDESRVVDADPSPQPPRRRDDGVQEGVVSAGPVVQEGQVRPATLFEEMGLAELPAPRVDASRQLPAPRPAGAPVTVPLPEEEQQVPPPETPPVITAQWTELPAENAAPPAHAAPALKAPKTVPKQKSVQERVAVAEPLPIMPATESWEALLAFEARVAAEEAAQQEPGSQSQATTPAPFDDGMLNPRYTFANFMVGASNGAAAFAAQMSAYRPGQPMMNPMLICGGAGLGKTHLLNAIGQVVRDNGLTVLYTTSENFVNEIIEAIRTHRTDKFRAKYREVDVLIIDDIQMIAGKVATEEEFFHTFNDLQRANKQVVLSCDRPPEQLGQIQGRLLSRLQAGGRQELHKPEYALRVAILRQKAKDLNLKLSDAIVEMFAKPPCESIRELEAIVARLYLYAKSQHRTVITMAMARELYASWQDSRQKRVFDAELVLQVIAQEYKVTVDELKSPKRSRAIAWPRQMAMYLMREKGGLCFEEIGAVLGGRDHSTVMHGVEQFARRVKTNTTLAAKMWALWEQMEASFPKKSGRPEKRASTSTNTRARAGVREVYGPPNSASSSTAARAVRPVAPPTTKPRIQ